MYTGMEISSNQKFRQDVMQYKNQISGSKMVGSFTGIMQKGLGINPIISELESQFNVTVTVASFSKTNDGSTFGLNGLKNVVISPKILKQMETNPKLKERIENDVKKLVDPIWDMETRAFFNISGLEERNRGIIVHDDGTVSWFGNAEPTEEEKQRTEQLKKNKESIKNSIYLPSLENPYEVKYTDKYYLPEQNSFLFSMLGSEYIQKKNKLVSRSIRI